MFDPKPIIKQLELNVSLFDALLSGISHEQSWWKPSPEKWSILEVIIHLIYEENHDFKARLDFALENYKGELPPIDPEESVNNEYLSKLNVTDALLMLKEYRKTHIEYLELIESNSTK